MTRELQYDNSFYTSIIDGSTESARVVLPKVFSLISNVQSVVDFGCGAGAWLHECMLNGCAIQGYDFGVGCENTLCIPADNFVNSSLTKPIITERYDLAISLEVAEHIPHTENEIYFRNITQASDILLFSAAIPNQGGTDHCNEQWPFYWIEKIQKQGFTVFDIIRPIIWHDVKIKWWYKQNLFLFVRNSALNKYEHFKSLPSYYCAPLVHPELLIQSTKMQAPHALSYHEQSNNEYLDTYIAQCREQILAMKNSLSWKITAPLRFVLDCIYTIRGIKK